MEGDQFGWPPIRIKLTMDVRDDEIWCDFTGTEMQVRGALNLPSFNMAGHYMLTIAFVNLFRTLNRNLPSNAGVVRPLHTYSPPGTLLNPEFPAAVGVRGATMYRVIDVAMATLGMALPDIMPAAGAGMSAIILLAARDSASGDLRVSVMQPLSGGGGGRPGMDGTNGTNIQGGWMRNIPNETLEAEMPVLVQGYSLRADSAGPGYHRGGWGVDFTFSVLAPSTTITARGMDRFNFPPWGARGGRHGTTADTLLRKHGEAEARSIGKVDALELQPGDRVTFLTQGGGGLGDPLTRDPAHVLMDVRSGLLSQAAAERDYGVVLANGQVDLSKTQLIRQHLSEQSESSGAYDFGLERQAYDARWTDELQSALVTLLLKQPRSWRAWLVAWLVAMSTSSGGPEAAGNASASGLVSNSGSRPPQGATYPLSHAPLLKAMPIMPARVARSAKNPAKPK
jgi:N-methylhydantoinase B